MKKTNFFYLCGGASLVGGLAGGLMALMGHAIDKALEDVPTEENGIVLKKCYNEVLVDLDGDKNADRVLNMGYWSTNKAIYEYAKPGDKIFYTNRNKRAIVHMEPLDNQVKQINEKSAEEIREWYSMKLRDKYDNFCK